MYFTQQKMEGELIGKKKWNVITLVEEQYKYNNFITTFIIIPIVWAYKPKSLVWARPLSETINL